MLRTLTALEGMSLHALDGVIGNVKGTYIDDETWTVRYLIVDTGTWLTGRSVLVTPHAVGAINWMQRRRYAQPAARRWDPARALKPDYEHYLQRFDRKHHGGRGEGRR